MREIRPSGLEAGGTGNRFSLCLSLIMRNAARGSTTAARQAIAPGLFLSEGMGAAQFADRRHPGLTLP